LRDDLTILDGMRLANKKLRDDFGGEASRDGWWLDGEPASGVISFSSDFPLLPR
jgi:hypothetical protein